MVQWMPEKVCNMPKTTHAIEKMGYEQALAELDEIVAALEGGETPLENAIKLYERGQALARHCAELLDQAELRLQVLTGNSSPPHSIEGDIS